jgi:hydrogenase nickel incorporation protein HypB
MCENCGCVITESAAHPHVHPAPPARAAASVESVSVLRDLLAENDRIAAHNREHFDLHQVLAINLMSSPGAGKTALLERTIEDLGRELRIGVIEGDLATENDARRIRAKGVPAVQITTGSACHLDAHMVHGALHDLALGGLDLLFIENVGNLVCPASFDLGQHLDVTLLSVPEGDDKPQKYPVMFRATDLLLLTKADLLPVLPEFDSERAEASLRAVGSGAPVMRLSSRTGRGFDAWRAWLREKLARHRARPMGEGRGGSADELAVAIDRVGG